MTDWIIKQAEKVKADKQRAEADAVERATMQGAIDAQWRQLFATVAAAIRKQVDAFNGVAGLDPGEHLTVEEADDQHISVLRPSDPVVVIQVSSTPTGLHVKKIRSRPAKMERTVTEHSLGYGVSADGIVGVQHYSAARSGAVTDPNRIAEILLEHLFA